MPSTFLGLTIATSGLYTYQTALNVTGNNISNVETDGYTRQEALQRASDALRAYTTYGQIGTGVVTTDITQIRNSYYDQKYWSSNTGYGEYNTKNYYMKQMESLFHEDDKTPGYTSAFDKLFNSLNSAVPNSDDPSYLTQFVNDAQSFAEYFNQLSTGLQSMQTDLNEEIKSLTDRVNSIAQQIHNLTRQINVSEMASGSANELRDQRALLIDQLSEIVPVEISETRIVSSDGFYTGATNYTVTIGGQKLVDNNSYNLLECVPRKEKVNQSDVEGLYEIQWENGMQLGVASSEVGGRLKALLDMRDGNNGENFKGKITDIEYVDAQNTKVTISSKTYENLNQMMLNDKGTIRLGNRPYTYDGFSAEFNETTGEYEYTFNITSGIAQINDTYLDRNASVGSSVDFCGVPYYMSQINEFARTFAQAANDIVVKGYNSGGTLGGILFTGVSAAGEEYDFALSGLVAAVDNTGAASVVSVKANSDETAEPDDSGKILLNGVYYEYTSYAYNAATDTYEYTLKDTVDAGIVGKAADVYSLVRTNANDSYYQLTAGNLKVTTDMLKHPEHLGTTSDPANGAVSGNILNELWGIQKDKNALSFRGGNATQFLTSIMSDIAVDAEKSKSFAEKYSNLVDTITNQRLSISGVDNDEEGTNLMKFQHAYDLSCQLVKVMQEIYDKLINQTGI